MSTYSWVYTQLCECFYCNICDELCIKRFFENHLKSQTHKNNFYKKISDNSI